MTGGTPLDDEGDTVYDQCGHGTHVAGIIAGDGAASADPQKCYRHFYGIAPKAGLVDVRVLDKNGQTDVSTVIAGIQWVTAHKNAYGIRVLNLSLGHPVGESYTTDPLCQAVESAWKDGIVVVCAAGNNGRLNEVNTAGLDNEGWGTAYGSINSPGNDPSVITVGAMKQDPALLGDRTHDQIASYSGRGPSRLDLVLKPDLVAPGNRVISLESPHSALTTAYGGSNDIPQSTYTIKPSAKTSKTYFEPVRHFHGRTGRCRGHRLTLAG